MCWTCRHPAHSHPPPCKPPCPHTHSFLHVLSQGVATQRPQPHTQRRRCVQNHGCCRGRGLTLRRQSYLDQVFRWGCNGTFFFSMFIRNRNITLGLRVGAINTTHSCALHARVRCCGGFVPLKIEATPICVLHTWIVSWKAVHYRQYSTVRLAPSPTHWPRRRVHLCQRIHGAWTGFDSSSSVWRKVLTFVLTSVSPPSTATPRVAGSDDMRNDRPATTPVESRRD